MTRPCTAALLAFASIAATLVSQNRAHPGQVPLGDGSWGTRAEAEARGLIEYHGRWLPKRLERKLRSWERQDRKVDGWEDAYRTKSKHYRIHTNLPRFIVELEIKPFLDALYRTYVEVFRDDFGLSARAADGKDIRIYFGIADYARHEGRDRSIPGFIVNGQDLVTYYEETDPARFYGTVFHEGAHQFFQAMLPGAELPLWLGEALATYFEGCTYSRVTNEITVRHVPPDRLQFAQNQLRRLAADRADPARLIRDVPRDRFGAGHYALAWSWLYTVTHLDDGAHRKGFGKLLRATNGAGARTVAELFDKHVGVRIGNVDARWREFVLALEAGEMPQWIAVAVEAGGGGSAGNGGNGDGPDVHDGDLVWSVDGVEIYSARQFHEVWSAARKAGEPFEIVLVRRDPPDDPLRGVARFVGITAHPAGGLRLRAASGTSRAHNLVD